MGGIVVWALATGAITGGIWVGTVLVSHLRRLAKEQLFLSAQLENRLDQLDRMETQLADMETRLEFTERLLSAGPPTESRALPGDTVSH